MTEIKEIHELNLIGNEDTDKQNCSTFSFELNIEKVIVIIKTNNDNVEASEELTPRQKAELEWAKITKKPKSK